MITLKPSTLYFNYTGVELAKQNVTVLQSPPQFYDNPGYKIQVSYLQDVTPWLLILDQSNNLIANIVNTGIGSRFYCKHNHSTYLPDGNYSAEIYFAAGNINLSNQFSVEEDAFMMVYLSVKAGNVNFTVTPNSAVLHVVKSSSEDPNIELEFTSTTDFTAEGNPHLTLDYNDLPEDLTPSSTPLLSISATARTLPNGIHNAPIEFKNGSQLLGTLPVKLIVTETNQLEVFPTSLYFEEIKNVEAANEQIITVYDPSDNCILTAPTWLNYTLISNEDNFKKYAINVSSDGLDPALREDVLAISDANNTVQVNLTYKLIGLYNYGYEKAYHFTQDAEYLEFIKSELNENTFLRLQMNIKIYQFNGEVSEFNRTQDLYFFQNKVKFDAGAFIHHIFKNYEGENTRYDNLIVTRYGVPQYQFASILFSVSEVNFDTTEVYHNYLIPEQYYVLGRDPRIGELNKILSHRVDKVTRVTAKSIISFNYLRYNSSILEFYKNGQRWVLPTPTRGESIPQGTDVRIFGGLINLATLSNIQVNDLIDIKFDSQVLSYIVEDEGLNSVNCLYVDQFGLLSSFEFTGEFEINSDYERITTSNFKNWVETTKILFSEKIQNIKVNSGYISPENVRILDEISLSPKVYLIIDNQVVEARPITQKLNNQTTDDLLHNRLLEFELKNNTHDHFHSF